MTVFRFEGVANGLGEVLAVDETDNDRDQGDESKDIDLVVVARTEEMVVDTTHSADCSVDEEAERDKRGIRLGEPGQVGLAWLVALVAVLATGPWANLDFFSLRESFTLLTSLAEVGEAYAYTQRRGKDTKKVKHHHRKGKAERSAARCSRRGKERERSKFVSWHRG